MSKKTTAPQQAGNRIYPLETLLQGVRSMAAEITEYADESTVAGREIRALAIALTLTVDGFEREQAEESRAKAARAWQLLEEAERWLADNPSPAVA